MVASVYCVAIIYAVQSRGLPISRNGPNLYVKYSLNHSRGIQVSLNAKNQIGG